MGSHLLIDTAKCIGCGICVTVCIRDGIVVSNGKAVENQDGRCFDCGQCEAACPRDAIRLTRYEGFEPEPVEQGSPVEYDDMVDLLSKRRSCRLFVGGSPEGDELSRLFEAVRNSPTAENSQDVEYAVLSDRMPEFLRLLAEILEPESGRFPRISQFCSMEDPGRLGGHPLIWDGRTAILAFSEIPADAVIAMVRLEITAYTMGLGGFYSRWIQMSEEVDHEKLMSFFPDIPKEKGLQCVFVIGKPKTRYRRTVARDGPKVHIYRCPNQRFYNI